MESGYSNLDFHTTIKKLKSDVDHQTIGDKVVDMNQSTSGETPIEIYGNATAVDDIKSANARFTDNSLKVRTLAYKGLLEIKEISS